MARPNASGTPASTLPRGTRVACAVSTYHFDLVGEMAASARDTLLSAGLAAEHWLEVQVPGAFELPLVAQRLARRPDVDAVLTFGLVLKGETEHDRYIADAVSKELLRIGLEQEKPVLFGVLTCATLEQARARARRESEGGLDKGREVAVAAIESLRALRDAGAPVVGRSGSSMEASR